MQGPGFGLASAAALAEEAGLGLALELLGRRVGGRGFGAFFRFLGFFLGFWGLGVLGQKGFWGLGVEGFRKLRKEGERI